MTEDDEWSAFDAPVVQAENANVLHDAGDTEKTSKRDEEIAFKARTKRDWWIAALDTEVGRSCIWELTQDFFVDSPWAATPTGFPDSNATFFRLGQRDKSERLYHSLLAMAPEKTLLMLQAHHPKFARVTDG